MFGFPLLLIPLAVCNIIVFLMPGVSFAAALFTVPLMSGAGWTVTLSDALVALGLLLLLLEVQKSARPGGKYLTDHLLALLIFAGAAVEFVMLPQFANATFFLLTLIALVDFLSGLALRGRRPKRVREVVAAEPISQPVRAETPASAPMRPVRAESSRAEPVRTEPASLETIRPEPILPASTPSPSTSSTLGAAAPPARADAGHAESAEPVPPRVEPIVDMDPMLGEPKDGEKPAPRLES